MISYLKRDIPNSQQHIQHILLIIKDRENSVKMLNENWKAVKLECMIAYWGNSTRRTSHSFQFLRVPLWIEMPVFKWKVFSDHLEIFTISLFTNYSVLHFLGERETKLWASFCFLKFLKFNKPSISILSTFLCYVTYQRSYVM